MRSSTPPGTSARFPQQITRASRVMTHVDPVPLDGSPDPVATATAAVRPSIGRASHRSSSTSRGDAFMIDDWLDVKGDPDESGVLHARSGWVFVNIGRRDGEIVEVANDGLLVNVKGRSVPIQLSPSVEVIDKTDGSSILSGVSALSPGDQVGMVGLRLPEGAFRATRIWR